LRSRTGDRRAFAGSVLQPGSDAAASGFATANGVGLAVSAIGKRRSKPRSSASRGREHSMPSLWRPTRSGAQHLAAPGTLPANSHSPLWRHSRCAARGQRRGDQHSPLASIVCQSPNVPLDWPALPAGRSSKIVWPRCGKRETSLDQKAPHRQAISAGVPDLGLFSGRSLAGPDRLCHRPPPAGILRRALIVLRQVLDDFTFARSPSRRRQLRPCTRLRRRRDAGGCSDQGSTAVQKGCGSTECSGSRHTTTATLAQAGPIP